MLLWSHIQSVLQLVVALSAIYTSLHDIRLGPVQAEFTRLARQLSALKALQTISKSSPALNSISDEIADNSIALNSKIHRFASVDKRNSVLCAIAAVIYVPLLIASAIFSLSEINVFVAIFICTVGFVPIGLSFYDNLRLVLEVRREVAGKANNIDVALAEQSRPHPTAAVT